MQTKLLGLSTEEIAMISEISEVMSRYAGKTRKFGVNLTHSHFSLKENEVLHETNDPENRVLTLKPVLETSLPESAYPTSWSIDEKGKATVNTWCCDASGK